MNNFFNSRFLISYCAILLFSCSGNNENKIAGEKPQSTDTSYKVIHVASQWENDLDKKTDTIFYSESVTEDIYTIKYSTGKDTDIYVLKADENFDAKLFSKGINENNSSFHYDGKRPFQIGNDVFAIYKYAAQVDSSGCSSNYWNPRLGIFYTKSNKWKTFNIVHTINDTLRNTVTGKLIMLIEKDSVFANVCPELKQDSIK